MEAITHRGAWKREWVRRGERVKNNEETRVDEKNKRPEVILHQEYLVLAA